MFEVSSFGYGFGGCLHSLSAFLEVTVIIVIIFSNNYCAVTATLVLKESF